MFLSWWRALVKAANPKSTWKVARSWPLPRALRYAARVEQLEDRLVPSTTLKLDVGASSPIVQASAGSTVKVFIDIGTLDGAGGISSAQFYVKYDPTVLGINASAPGTAGSDVQFGSLFTGLPAALAQDYSLGSSTGNAPGVVGVAIGDMAGTFYTGTAGGQLVELDFHVLSAAPALSSTLLNLSPNSGSINNSTYLQDHASANYTFNPALLAYTGSFTQPGIKAPNSFSPTDTNLVDAAIEFPATATTTTVSTSNATPVYGTAVTLTATVTPASGALVPTQGSVQFFNGTTLLGSGTFSNPQDANHDAIFTYVTTATQLQVAGGGPQAITATYTAGAGFTGSTSTNVVTETVTPLTLAVTGITASDKVYDSTTAATLNTSGGAVVGYISGDAVTLVTTGAVGTFATKDVGAGKTVVVSGLGLAGAQAADYALPVPQETTTANITPKLLTIAPNSITANNKVYNATRAASLNTSGAALVGAIFPGDTVTLVTTNATGTFDTKDVGTGKTVTVTGLTLGGAQGVDYALPAVQETTTANITPKALDVTGIAANNKVYDGTTTATLNTSGVILSGKFGGDDVSLAAGSGGATFDTKDVGTGKTVTISGLSLTGAQAADYALPSTPLTTSANVTPKALTVSGITAGNKVYDHTTVATLNTSGATLAGVLTGDSVTLVTTGAVGTFDTKDVGTGKTVTVSGLSLTGAQAFDYALPVPQQTTTANITALTLTVSGITANDKVYDQTTAATLNTGGATLSGVFSGDAVTLVTTGAVGTFATKDVGTAKTVTVSGLSLAGAQASDYALPVPQATTQANITPKAITVTGITATKVYDATTLATLNTTNAALVGVFGGDTVTLNTAGAVGTYANKDVGTNIPLTVTGLTLGGAQAADYTLPPLGTGAPTGVVAYYRFEEGAPNAFAFGTNSILDSSGNGLNGTPVNGPVYRVDVGANPIPQTGAVNNLALALNGGFQQFVAIPDNPLFQLTRSLTIEAYINVATFQTTNTTNQQEIVFRGDDQPGLDPYQLEISNSNLVFMITDATNTSASVSVPFSAFQNKWAFVTASLNDATGTMSLYINGNLAGSTTTTVRPYGPLTGTNPGLSIGNVQDSTTASEYFNGLIDEVRISNQALQPNQFLDSPPQLTLATGTITPFTLTVTGVTASNKVYDSTTTATLNVTNASLVGVFGGDTVTLVTTGRVGTFASKNVGTNIPVTVTGLTLGGAQAGDYILTQPATSANITPRALTGAFTAANKPYDGTTTATIVTRSLTGVEPTDIGNVTLTGGTATFSDPNVGNGKTVTGTGFTLTGTAASDYSLPSTPLTTTANITALTVTGSFTAANKPYDGTTTATITSRSLTGVLAADAGNVTLTGGTATFSDPNIGNGKTVTGTGFTLAGTAAANYTLASSTLTTTANITALSLTVSGITANNKMYDGTTAATLNTSGAILTGVHAGDAVTLVTSGAVGTFDTKDVGTGKTVTVSGLSLTGAQAADYALPTPQETTTANITAKALTVSGITASNKVYDGTTAATLNTSGAALMGVLTGDAVTLVTSGAVGAFITKDVGTGKTVTVSGLSLTGAQASDYTLPVPQATTTANITSANLTVTGVTANDKVYDTTTIATLNTAGAVLVGVYSGDSVSLVATGATGTFATQAVGNNIPVTISGLTLGGAQAIDYTLTQPTTTANITPDLVNNPLVAVFGVPATITSMLLRADSASNPTTVVFTLISVPTGILQDGSTTLTVGSTFTQADINAGNLVYTGNAIGQDSFQFTATDGHGGTVPLSTFHITVIAEVLPPALIGNMSGLEGVSGLTPFVFHVSLGAVPLTPVIFDVFTTDGTAVSVGANPNFLPIFPGVNSPPYNNGTLSFARGQVRQTITVYVLGGSLPASSPPKYFIVSLSNPAFPTGVVATATGTIVGQDPPPSLVQNVQGATTTPITTTTTPTTATTTPAASPFGVPLTSTAPSTPIVTAPAVPVQPPSALPTPFAVSLVSTNPPTGASTAALDLVFGESLTNSSASNTDALDQVFAVLGSDNTKT